MVGRLVTILLLLFFAQIALAQSEFMIYGRVRQPDGNADSILLSVRSPSDKGFKKDIYLVGKGEYRIFMKYGNEYVFNYSKKGFLPLIFDVSTVLPPDKPQCCQTPLELSFRMIAEGSEFDDLFSGTFMDVRYENKLKGYNYDIDIDYHIQTMVREAQLNKLIAVSNELRRKKIADSMLIENKYFGYISRGNAYYAAKNYTAARETFNHALEVKPDRQYPRYKLEDIRTAEEKFGNNSDSLLVRERVEKPKTRTFEIPQIPAFVYNPPAQEVIAKQAADAIAKQVAATSASPEIAKERMAFMHSLTVPKDTVPQPIVVPHRDTAVMIATQVETEMEVSIPHVGRADGALIRKEEQNKQTSLAVFFDDTSYQDSLRMHYPKFKTEVVEENLYKKTTRVFINKNNRVTIFMKVEHAWGGIYYFIDRTPLVPENISQGFFDAETRSVDFLSVPE